MDSQDNTDKDKDKLREILSKGGMLGQLKVFHKTDTDEYLVQIDNIARTNKAKFTLKEYRFIVYQQINYLKSQGQWDKDSEQ